MTGPRETFTSGAATEWRPSRFPGVSSSKATSGSDAIT